MAKQQPKLKAQSFDVDDFERANLQRTYGGQSQRSKQPREEFSDEQKRMYYIGLGSTLSQSEEGRKKHVTAMTHGDRSLIKSYKQGRDRGKKSKAAYLERKRAARRTAKGK